MESHMQTSVLDTAPTTQYRVPRRHPRSLFTVPVTLQRWLPDGCFETQGISLDLSVGGIAVAVPSPPLVGEQVSIEIHAPDRCCRAQAIVRYNNKKQCGLEFHEPEPSVLQLIATVNEDPVGRKNVFTVK
jgi:PilZ domain